MHYPTLLLMILFLACSVPNSARKTRTVSKVVFRQYYAITEEGERNAAIVQDSFRLQMARETELDSAKLVLLEQYSLINMIKASKEFETHIEIHQDTIWRYQKQNGKVIGPTFRIDREKGILHYHTSMDQRAAYRQVNLFDIGGDYTMEEFLNDRKSIMGYPCHKVVIRKKDTSPQAFTTDLGDSIYEMYVAREIDLPVHALWNATKSFPGIFPLEVRTWETKLSGIQEVYEVREIGY